MGREFVCAWSLRYIGMFGVPGTMVGSSLSKGCFVKLLIACKVCRSVMIAFKG